MRIIFYCIYRKGDLYKNQVVLLKKINQKATENKQDAQRKADPNMRNTDIATNGSTTSPTLDTGTLDNIGQKYLLQ